MMDVTPEEYILFCAAMAIESSGSPDSVEDLSDEEAAMAEAASFGFECRQKKQNKEKRRFPLSLPYISEAITL